MNFLIKEYRPKYKAGIFSLFQAVDKEFIPSITERGFDNCFKEILAEEATLLIAFSDNEIVGVLSYFVGNDYLHIDWLADHPNFRHHRLACVLIEEAILRAKKIGKSKVELKTWSTNIKALQLYGELGFKVSDTKKDDRGKGIDTISLVLKLNN